MTDINAPTIAGFEILGKLGQGGMAIVWMARQLSLDRSVAIKVLLPRFAVDEDEVSRFRSEAQAAARLKHPGIVQVYDASVTDGCYYFVMEFIAGYTVGDWLRRKGTLAERDALLVAEHVCDALAYAWDHAKVIHCDIKPDNIMIDEDGTVKVTDLGLARTLNAMSSYTEDDDHVLGTPSYMSPEQARGDAHLDFRSDIYSLGAMLYHLVTGTRLFSEYDDYTALEMQITGTAPDPMDIDPSLSRPFCALLERMLSKNPDLRGESWQAVHADMRRVYSGLMPHHTLQPDDLTTIQRSERRTTVDAERLQRLTKNQKHESRRTAVWTTLWCAHTAVAIALAIKFYIKVTSPHSTPPVKSRVTQPPSPNVHNTRRQTGKPQTPESTLFEAAAAWQRQNPDDPDGAISRFENVIRATRGTAYERQAETAITLLRAERRKRRQQEIENLMQQINTLKDAGEYNRAEALVATYKGNQPEDQAMRERMIMDIQRHHKAREAEARLTDRKRQEVLARAVMTPVLQGAANAIIQDDLQQAIDLIEPLRAREDLSWYHDSLSELVNGLTAWLNIDQWVMETFRPQQGQTIEITFDNNISLLEVGTLQDGQLQCFLQDENGEFREILITAQDLDRHERIARLGSVYPGVAAIARGTMARRRGKADSARRFFRQAHFLMADPLLQAIGDSHQP